MKNISLLTETFSRHFGSKSFYVNKFMKPNEMSILQRAHCSNMESLQGVTAMLQHEHENEALMIRNMNTVGFQLNFDTFAHGSIIMHRKHLISWKVKKASDITPDSLRVIGVLKPKMEILVIGLDEGANVSEDVRKYLRSIDIKVEIHPVRLAAEVFNFLTMDGRLSVAAFIPPKKSLMPEKLSPPKYSE